MIKLNHFNEAGDAHMVDVSGKDDTHRIAVAAGQISMQSSTLDVVRSGTASKGDVLGVARVAGIMATKNTSQLIPMCHPLMITGVEIDFDFEDTAVNITATVKTTGKTGVEMEALTAVSVAALTVYDMVKAIDRGMTIGNIRVCSKSGGASGNWQRNDSRALNCDDGVCEIDFGTTPVEVNLSALAGLGVAGTPTQHVEPGSET